jgi:tricorn protease
MNVNFAEEKMEIFKQGWRLCATIFTTKNFTARLECGLRDLRAADSGARTNDEVRRLMNLMVGELNASHLGVSGAPGFTPTPIGKLGLRFDRNEYETNGRLKITEIITLSPAAVTCKKSKSAIIF